MTSAAENHLKALELLADNTDFYVKVSTVIPEELTIFERLSTHAKELARNKQELELLSGDLQNLQQHIEEREEIIAMYCTCSATTCSGTETSAIHTRRRSSDSKSLSLKQTHAW